MNRLEKTAFLCVFFVFAFGRKNFFARVRIVAQEKHCGGVRHRSGREVLHLFNVKVLVFSCFMQCFHIVEGAGGMCGDEVGHELQMLTQLAVELLKALVERAEGFK